MAVDEASRFALHERARDAFGDEAAATMMELLPPVGWGDVARTRDLDALEERLGGRLDGRIDALEQRLEHFEERVDLKLAAIEHRLLAALHAGLTAQTRALIATSTATAVGFGGLLLAAVRLGGG